MALQSCLRLVRFHVHVNVDVGIIDETTQHLESHRQRASPRITQSVAKQRLQVGSRRHFDLEFSYARFSFLNQFTDDFLMFLADPFNSSISKFDKRGQKMVTIPHFGVH